MGGSPCFASPGFLPLFLPLPPVYAVWPPLRSPRRPTRRLALVSRRMPMLSPPARASSTPRDRAPKTARYRITFVRMPRADGNMAAAIADYTQALALMPNLVPSLSGRAIAYRASQNYDLSLHDLSQAIAIQPNNADLYNSRGNTYQQMGNPT